MADHPGPLKIADVSEERPLSRYVFKTYQLVEARVLFRINNYFNFFLESPTSFGILEIYAF